MNESPVETSRWSGHRLRKVGATTVAYVLLGGVLALILVRIDQQDQQRCEDNRDNREVLIELVAESTSGDPVNIEALTSLPEWQALDENDQAFWRVVLTGLGDGTSTTDRIKAFAKERLTPITCD